jgi:hypothetical protein
MHIHITTVLLPNFQVPFLSMDLNALANHLSKIKLSRRLFIEEDLFPEDMVCSSLYLFTFVRFLNIENNTIIVFIFSSKGIIIHSHFLGSLILKML